MKLKLIVTAGMIIALGSIGAQKGLINRETEALEFPDLRFTEVQMEKNILDANQRLGTLGHLVELARRDREAMRGENQNRLDFRYMDRTLRFTPRNTYVRFVSEQPSAEPGKPQATAADFILAGYGDSALLMAMVQERVKAAQAANIPNVKDLVFSERSGIELTQFEFVYRVEQSERVAIGSQRKSVALYFKQAEGGADKEQKLKLDMVVCTVVEDDLASGMKDMELIIDPTPLDEQNDDIIIFHRYNQKPTKVAILGAMSNTANFPHRMRFKQKFYMKLLDHFYRLYRLVDGYANMEGNSFNQGVIENLEEGLSY